MIYNVMEQIMIDLFDEYRDRLGMKCTCSRCQSDVLALALNKTPPRYISQQDKAAYVKAEFVDKQEMTTLLVKLAECSKIVSDQPYCRKSGVAENSVPYLYR
ncbi:competence protein ComFB [Bacillus lacus]|uniref:Competence protein ComFB n=2 Tax=Metabacillus lacus TaxID=1983721 RepID=A0A7X2IYK7_9BACI|nr:late competence development ComFB family protein [Metabacillus lacus]MRX72181.1 competence protein ComFB [Metabacillus lacus]